MKHTDFRITHVDNSYFTLSRKKPIFLFFYKWEDVTYTETEICEPKIMTFNSLEETKNFIDSAIRIYEKL